MQEGNMTDSGQFAQNPKSTTRTVQTRQSVERSGFVEMTLTGEVTLSVIKEPGNSFAPHGDGEVFSGSTLHFGDESALIETDRIVPEGALLSLCARLESSETISDFLALVTRIDQEDETWIMGISFVGRDQLADILSGAELELLDNKFGSFSTQVKRLLAQPEFTRREHGKEV